ncbi:MAG: hypothetical protein OXP68_05675 [Anaerolineaceae bacterium]|nr:hypothetical protein [Anaerolineaceae bacterium]MDE0327575.1 hypothetical protein [Anaerolineaceae bacterium]
MKLVMRGMAIVAALLLASVAGVTAQASVPTCGPAQSIVAAVDLAALAQLQSAAAGAEQSAAMVALAELLSQLEEIVMACPDAADGDPDALAGLTVDAPLTVYVREDERLSGQLLKVSLESTFDVEQFELDLTVRAGVRSSDYLQGDAIFGGDPPVQLTGFEDEIRKDDITLITITVGGILDDKRNFRCELSEQQDEVDVYACTER